MAGISCSETKREFVKVSTDFEHSSKHSLKPADRGEAEPGNSSSSLLLSEFPPRQGWGQFQGYLGGSGGQWSTQHRTSVAQFHFGYCASDRRAKAGSWAIVVAQLI